MISRRRKGVKTWRLSYLDHKPGRSSGYTFLSFLTVKEALEWVKDGGIVRFHLEDHVDVKARTH